MWFARPGTAATALAAAVAARGAAGGSILAPTPPGFNATRAVLLADNLAVIPGEWTVPDFTAPFYTIQTNDSALSADLARIAAADFIGFSERFFDVLGPDARVETLVSFPGEVGIVHEAPTYLPDSRQLLFSDTSRVGLLYLLDVDTNRLRNVTVTPPLANVNGGTYHAATQSIYVTTNGSPVRGVYRLTLHGNNDTASAVPVANNYRGKKLNSPNDIVVDRAGNLWFTDPAYGWYNEWPGVGAPELPNAVYFFNSSTRSLVAASNDVVLVPNGLALAPDQRTLYVSDTNATSGRPSMSFPSSVRNIYAFEIRGSLLEAPRMVYQAADGVPDGFRVSQSGLIFASTGDAVDVVDPATGELLGKINSAGDNVFNVQFVPGEGTLFLTSNGRVRKVTGLREKGL